MKVNKDHSVKSLQNEIDALQKTLKQVFAQTEADCKSGNHLTRGYATGGRDGEWLTYCLCCDYSERGYD